jgi:hypothetical protein
VLPKWTAKAVNVPMEVLDEVDRLIKKFKKKKKHETGGILMTQQLNVKTERD